MNGCGCVVALAVLVAAFFFGPWAVIGWVLVVVIVMAIAGALSD